MLEYALAPITGYLVGGGTKFVLNSVRLRRLAVREVGLGGIPSTHNTMTATVTALVAFREGIASPAFGVALTFALLTAIDAMDLRQKVARHARILARSAPDDPEAALVRHKMGHTPLEVLAGWLVGTLCGAALSLV